jgi:hypothetical protein
MHAKTAMAAIFALTFYSILQAGSGPDDQFAPSARAASLPAATAPVTSAPAATSRPAALSQFVEAIHSARDASSVASAYAHGCTIDRKNLELHEAYMRRTLQLGRPEMAIYGARAIVAQDPSNGLAWAVIGYDECTTGRLAPALADTILALKTIKDDPAIINNAGQLLAFHDLYTAPRGNADMTKITQSPRNKLASKPAPVDAYTKLRNELADKPAFADAYALVKAVGEKEQARRDDLNRRIAAASGELDSAQANADQTRLYDTDDYMQAEADLFQATKDYDDLRAQLSAVIMPRFHWKAPSVDGIPTPEGHEIPPMSSATSHPAASQPSPLNHETLAARELELAKDYISAKMNDKAITELAYLMQDYPQTKAAKEARQLLDQLSAK